MSRENVLPVRRRTLIAALGTGTALALAGCSGDGGDSTDGSNGGGGTPTATPTPTTEAAVPAQYETATALGGQERSPASLASQSSVSYQPDPNGKEQCSNCTYYIKDKNDDGMGACAIVEGTIEPTGWCVSYAQYQGTETPTSAEAVEVPPDATCAVCGMSAADFPDWNGQVVHADSTRAFFCSSGCTVTYHVAPDSFAVTSSGIAGLWVTDFETGQRIDGTTAYYALETDSERIDDPMRLNPAPFAARDDAVAYVEAVDYLTTDDIVELAAFDRELAAQYRDRFLD